MNDHDFDKIFRDNIESTQMEVDANEIWDRVNANEKNKRRRLPFWLFFGLIVGIIGLGTWYITQETETEKHSSLDQEQSQNFLKEINTTKSKEAELSLTNQLVQEETKVKMKPSTTSSIKVAPAETNLKTNRNIIQRQEKIVLGKNVRNTLFESDNIFVSKKRNFSNSQKETSSTSISSINKSSSEYFKKEQDISNEENDKNGIKKLTKIKLLIEYLPLRERLLKDNNRVRFDFVLKPTVLENIDKEQEAKWEIGTYVGLGIINKQLANGEGRMIDWVDKRKQTETDRFSYSQGINVTRWLPSNFGISVDLDFQRHYSYFEEEIITMEFKQDEFESSFFQNTRVIKSNVIINQLHAGLSVKYNWSKARFNLQPTVGVSYNLIIKGSGKFYTQPDTISEVSEEENFFQSAGLGLNGGIILQYTFKKNLFLNGGFKTQISARSILKDNRIEQNMMPMYFTLGLSKKF